MDNVTPPTCPKDGAPMRLRKGKLGQFWGCTKYPNCTYTIDVRDKRLKQQKAVAKEFTPSKYQQAIFDFVASKPGNAVVEAVAGSGKTTTIVKALELTTKKAQVLFCAFNKHIQEELSNRAPEHVSVLTLHSMGFGALNKALPTRPEVDDYKMMGIAKELIPDEDLGFMRSALCKLVGFAKNTLVDFEDAVAIKNMIDYYGIDLYDREDDIIKMLLPALQKCYDRLTVIDYDDMLWLPLVLNVPMPLYDNIFVDESQDLCAAQFEMLARSLIDTSRVVAVGDTFQSIYGFRGALPTSMRDFKDKFEATSLPLSICYRCPTSHIELARQIVPQIEAAPDAEIGTVQHASMMKALTSFQDGDLVLCRVNAPLVTAAYSLLRKGVKACIRGRDIGAGLLHFIDSLKADNIVDLMGKMTEYKDREVARLEAANKSGQVQTVLDKCETLGALCEGLRNLSELRARIGSIFDDKTKGGVVFSSVHRAKGDEANRVWILKPQLLPHPKATKEHEMQQEENLRYVAYTRSKRDLIFVED
jgi:DNA helicase-2/ATP-dependent DNA helicase PcrA